MVAFFEHRNWFNWQKNGTLCPNLKHLWEEKTGPCCSWSIKKPKLSKMNSTCSMKAWHRCVSLWGPPGRLHSQLSWGNGFKSAGFFLLLFLNNKLAGCACVFCKTIWAPEPVDCSFTCVVMKAKRSTAVTLVPIAPPCGKAQRSAECSLQPPNWLEVVRPRQGEKPFKWSRCGRRAEALSYPSSVVALASLVTQLITLVLRRFIALHSNCTNAPDSQTAFMAALLRQQGGCPVIRDGIPARSKGCARQGRAMAKRSNHKLQPLSLRLWPFWLSYMNANALWLAPINTVITTANMASQAKGGCCCDSVAKVNQLDDTAGERYRQKVLGTKVCALNSVDLGISVCFG